MNGRLGRVVALGAWLVLLVATIVGAGAAGRGALAAPPWRGVGDLRAWIDQRNGVEAAFALIRVGLLGMAWYLLATTVAALVARAARAGTLVVATDAVTPDAVRRLVQAVVGVSLVASALTVETAGGPGVHPAAAQTAAAADPVMIWLGPDRGGLPVMRRLPDAAPDPSPPQAEGLPPLVQTEWTVAPGDHLWRVAEEVLSQAWSHPASDAQIAPYWARLVTANRHRLADPANPSLLFPGQVLTVPEPPASPS